MQFCAYDACQSGKCLTREPTEWIRASDGNSTDGTCGGERRSTCSVVWGQCCNKNGKCGTGYDDCFANW
ncbi:uncharacterized protein B0I36DRAFT_380737 [Microdochium trichocladiopsis]|uniref:Chitin-binding type-1 domain-containing protein n=1 Tax=Microdochium trichocladiopsis TaxID=1682393 RepID=A0A9P8YES7_9PEZI|nr:uncharacterized protein B0I36DRAFT_380737 [Microdochium trichocladiopsis]KAH7037562.1 hypothetical protein B0I36DRAFT_380737 [Microdochium trichocladiopsis]